MTTERANFEVEMTDIIADTIDKHSRGDLQCAQQIAASVERIVGNDAGFISSLQVPEDIVSIDDVDRLRQLLACERKLRQRVVS